MSLLMKVVENFTRNREESYPIYKNTLLTLSLDMDVPRCTETPHTQRPNSSWLSNLFPITHSFFSLPLQLVASLLNLYVFLKMFSSPFRTQQLSLNFSISLTLPSAANVSTDSHQVCLNYFVPLSIVSILSPSNHPNLKWSINYCCLKSFRFSAAYGLKSKLLSVHEFLPI